MSLFFSFCRLLSHWTVHASCLGSRNVLLFPKPRPVGKSSLASNWFHPASSITLVYSQTASNLETGSLGPPLLLLLKSASMGTVSYWLSELMCQPSLQLALIWKLASACKAKHLTANCLCQIDGHLIWKGYLSRGTLPLPFFSFSAFTAGLTLEQEGVRESWQTNSPLCHLPLGTVK